MLKTLEGERRVPRRPRVFVDGAAYHVFCRTGRAEPIFRDRAEAREFTDALSEVKRHHGLALLAWCLMPGHYHLVLRTGRVPLWRSMRLIQGRFAKSFNRRHGLYGAVWQGRYKAKLIADEGYLRQAVVYVHLNPSAAGLARDPGAYPWSGHRELMGTGGHGLLDVDESLAAFGSGRSEGRATYRQALRGAGAAAWLQSNPLRLPWWRVAGAGDELELNGGRPRLDALGASTADAGGAPNAATFVAEASALWGIHVEYLKARRSDRERTRAREALAWLAVERYGIRIKDLARELGRPPGAVGRWVAGGAARWPNDPAFHERVQRLADSLDAVVGPHVAPVGDSMLGQGASFVD